MNQAKIQSEPTHDEIALCAFLLWEKDGRQSGRETTYWLQAEAQVKLTRQQEAELVAAKSSRPWPPATSTTAKVATARAVAPATAKPATAKPAAAKPAAKPVKAAVVAQVDIKPVAIKPAARKTSSAAPRKALARA